MRSDLDLFTAELPGIPELKTVRASVKARKLAVAYVDPQERSRCGTCRHCPSGEKDETQGKTLLCTLHGFRVHKGAVCEDWVFGARRTK